MRGGNLVRAVVDIGSNSVKCVVAQGVGPEGQIIRELSQVTRLGEELAATGKIGPGAAERNLAYLSEVRNSCRELGVEQILCVGAETLRRAEDAEHFARQLKCLAGWDLRVLTPEEEARLSFEAASELAPADEACLVLDSGGGSTEFSFRDDHGMRSSHSLPLGALTLTKSFMVNDPSRLEELDRLRNHIQDLLEKAFPFPKRMFTVACGGGSCALAAVALALEPFEAGKVQGFWLSGAELASQIDLYGWTRESERPLIKGLPPGREGIILASALILEGILRHFGLEGAIVSSQGLRHALLAQKHLGWFQPFV